MPSYLNANDLKVWLHRRLSQTGKLMIILASMDSPCQIQDMRAKAKATGFQIPPRWNMSALLAATKGRAIRTSQGWELTDLGRQYLGEMGVATRGPNVFQQAETLRVELPKIRSGSTRAYVEEAVKCCEYGLFRSAIVMSWVGAVAILRDVVHAQHLPRFNADMGRVDKKWKVVATTDDFGRMREFDFLECVGRLGVIGKDVKEELKECLRRRNSCGHPNSLQLSTNVVAAHLEVLILNVFKRFA